MSDIIEANRAKVNEIVKANVDAAIDQRSEYPTAECACAAYLVNVLDTLIEEGIHRAWREVAVTRYLALYAEETAR